MEPKERIYGEFARIGKALSSPARLELLELLSQSEKTVEELAGEARLGVKNTSAHLRVLREARLVETRKAPPYVYYALADDAVAGVVRELQTLARRRLAEVDRIARLYFESPSELEPVSAAELHARLRAGEVVVLDVRPAEEYRAGRLPNAVSIPIDELERRLDELPKDVPIVAYCRGPYCVYARDAVELLRRHGYEASRMADGVPDWRRAGLPVELG